MQQQTSVLDLFDGLTIEQARRLRNRIIPVLMQERDAVLRGDTNGAGREPGAPHNPKQQAGKIQVKQME